MIGDNITPAAILRGARRLLETRDRWTQERGRVWPVGADTSRVSAACARCLLFAIFDAHPLAPGRAKEEASRYVARAIEHDVKLGGSSTSWLTVWNDKPGRTHAEVLAAIDGGLVLAEKDEARA